MSSRCALPLLLTLFVLTGPWAVAATTAEVVSLAPGAGSGSPEVLVTAVEPGGLTVTVTIPALESAPLELDGQSFRRLDLPNGGWGGEVGEPALPTLTRLVALPAGSGASARLLDVQMTELGAMRIAPQLPADTDDELAAMPFDAVRYAAAGPRAPAVLVGEPALLRGQRVVPVTFSPLAYDPATGQTAAARRMTVEISFAGRDDRNDPDQTRRSIPESFAAIYEQEVLGYQRDAAVATGPGSYIMICPDNSEVVGIVGKLADWRRRQGYNVLVVTTATTGTTNTAIKNWLQAQYDTLEPPLEFVTLVGDANGAIAVPTWTESYSGYNGEGDHMYTTLEGGDVLADIHIGRLSATSTTQLQLVVDKIFDYETAPVMTDTSWFTAAGLTGDPSTSGASCIYVNQFVKQELLKLSYTRIDTIWSPHFLNQMMASINQGATLFTYRGYLNMSGMSSSHILSLTNGRKLPFAVILTCGTGSFQSETTCRSEAFLRATGGGGVAAIGTATLGTSTRHNNCMFIGITDGVINSGDQRVGPSLTRGKLNMYRNFQVNEPNRVWIFSTWNNLMGDPATAIYTGVPAALDVTYPAQVSLGANALPVSVLRGGIPVAGARVAVFQAGTVRDVAYTDAAGQALLALAGAAAGDVFVTAFGNNLLAHLGQVAVGDVTRSLDVVAVAIQEVSGNGDQLANPGEVLDLQVQLANNGTSGVTGASATLNAIGPHVTVLDGTAEYGTVPAGQTAWGTYRVEVQAAAVGGETAPLRLAASGSGESWVGLVTLPVHGPRGALGAMTYSGPGGSLDPGESGQVSFALANVGDLGAGGVTATLVCASEWVTVTDAEGAWGAIPAGESRGQLDTFALAIAADCLPGHLTSLTLHLAFADGGTQVLEYPVVIGTAAAGDPTGPCAYGYWAFDNTDSHPLAPAYSWFELSGIGANVGISDTGRHDDDTRTVALPFAFAYYGETYDRISICSNGWLSFGATSLLFYRNWMLPADGTPDAMVAAFWTDLANGQVLTYHDTAQHRFVVQWEAFGNYTGSSYSGNCTFQILLYDPAHHPTDTGDGLIVVQYKNVTIYAPPPETNYFTTGIQNRPRTVGLTYAYGNHYAGGAATVQPGRAIAFRPVRAQTQGQLAGEVRNQSGGGTPISGATVSVLGSGRQLATAVDGRFQGGVPVGTWDIAVWHDSFAPDTTYGVTVVENEVATVDFDLADIRGPYFVGTTQVSDTADTAGPYVIESRLTDHTGVATRFLHYTSSSLGGPYTVALTVIDEATGLCAASIPGQPSGTRVQYWLSAADMVGNASRDPVAAPWPPYNFMVAEVAIIEDGGCESADGWTVDLEGSDTATAGVWEHGVPIGTWYNGQPVQPDGDHTPPPGVNCWFTGQHTSGESAGYNDVDNGHTTLTSPVYELAGAGTVQVSYYRWFSNDLGFSPGEDPWIVDVSNDGGQSWTGLESTLVSNNSWQPVSFVLNDLFTVPDRLRLRFRAEDYGGGSLVEAAVDDLRIAASLVVADLLPPAVQVTGPAAGTQHSQGHLLPVAWQADDDVGVVHARVWLSLDGGQSFDLLLAEGPLAGEIAWTIDVPPGEPSYAGRIRVQVLDAAQRQATAESAQDFFILTGPTAAPVPSQLRLVQNHPNPFNPRTVIAYDLPRAQAVELRVYDLQGKLVATLVKGEQAAGRHEVVWQGLDDRGGQAASGMYLYRLTTADGEQVRKMTLLK